VGRQELLTRISIDPGVCFGKPCIRGHRIWVSLVLDLLATGMTANKIMAEYPGLVEEDRKRIYAPALRMGLTLNKFDPLPIRLRTT
jgi:uncharacterized protein (DUF433 family)